MREPEARSDEVIVVLLTVPEREEGMRLGALLVEEGLAACVNVLPGVHSIFRWEGVLDQAEEALLLVKTTRGSFDRLSARVVEEHRYTLPEVIALPVIAGHAPYLAWVQGREVRG